MVFRDGQKLVEGRGVLGEGVSNNQSEYWAAIEAFRWLLENKVRDDRIVLRSDSKLLIKQLNGDYAVRGSRVRPLHEELRWLIEEVRRSNGGSIRSKFRWIPREGNGVADALSQRAYEEFCTTNPGVLRPYGDQLASERQKAFMKKLNLPIPAGLSKRMASRLIDDGLMKLRPGCRNVPADF